MNESRRESLDDLLAELPRELNPRGNLWPGIVRGIVRRPRQSLWPAFAAAAAIACLATALVIAVLHGRSRPIGGPGSATLALSFDEPRDSRYVAARSALKQTFEERLALLDPATRSQIETNLATIRKARDDIRRALAAQPDNPVLEQLLESAWHDEFDLYDDVVRTTQPTLARI